MYRIKGALSQQQPLSSIRKLKFLQPFHYHNHGSTCNKNCNPPSSSQTHIPHHIFKQIASFATKPRKVGSSPKPNRRAFVRRIIRTKSDTFRLAIKSSRKSEKWPKLHTIKTPLNILPQPIQSLPPNPLPSIPSPNSSTIAAASTRIVNKKARRKFSQWLRDNAGVIILNFGSVATLTAFTRTDILELRCLSIGGSLSSIIYFFSRPRPYVMGPIIWASIFAFTNAYMVYYIYEERKGVPRQLTSIENDVYEEHFLPHAVTPRQFEKLLKKARLVKLKRGEVLIQKGQELDKVYLVIQGATEAITGVMSRRVTAASSARGNKHRLVGGDAGAWVGEFSFLNYLSDLDQKYQSISVKDTVTAKVDSAKSAAMKELASTASSSPPVLNNMARTLATSFYMDESQSGGSGTDERDDDGAAPTPTKPPIGKNAILTYLSTEDSILYEWKYDELAELLATSSDLRSAITRAMTAAVVGKVVNMYASKADSEEATGGWTTWLKGRSAQNATDVSSFAALSNKVEGGNGGDSVHDDEPTVVGVDVTK